MKANGPRKNTIQSICTCMKLKSKILPQDVKTR